MVLSSSVASVSQASSPFSLLLDQAHDLDRVKQQYQLHYSEKNSYRFPGSTPRHPLLQRLCGMQEIVPQMPFWWADVLTKAPDGLAALLTSVSTQEFFQGRLCDAHAANLKQLGQDHQQPGEHLPTWAQSPRLGRILEAILDGGQNHPLYRSFTDRGSADTLSLFVSCHPWDILTMGSGKGFVTCQDLCGGMEAQHLPANLLDAGLSIAYVADPEQDRWEVRRMRARVLLRLFQNGQGHCGILIDRFYGDVGYGDAMWRTLTTLIGQAGVALWQPPLYLKRLKGSLCEFDGPRFQATGIPFSSPSPLPYLDQPGLCWKSANGQSSLQGTVVEVLQAT